MAWITHRIVVEVPVETGAFTETDVRYAVEHLIGGDKLHRELNRAWPSPRPMGRVKVKMWSKVKRWL